MDDQKTNVDEGDEDHLRATDLFRRFEAAQFLAVGPSRVVKTWLDLGQEKKVERGRERGGKREKETENAALNCNRSPQSTD
jgi:hypothetical protein